MKLQEVDNATGKVLESPNIIWDKDDRYALIAFLLMSVDKEPDALSIKKLDAFMGIVQLEESGNEGRIDTLKELRMVRDFVIREGGDFLNNLNRDDNYCEFIMDEIDHIIDGSDGCSIGNGYSMGLFYYKPNELQGGIYFLFDYLKLVINDGCYSENQKRLFKYLSRKWKVDQTVLHTLIESIKSLNKIIIKRKEIENSGMSYREAVSALSGLNHEEQTIWKKLNEFGITNDRAFDTGNYFNGKYFINFFFKPSIKDEREIEEEGIVDKIGDVIVDGIYKVGELICAPFEWLSGVR